MGLKIGVVGLGRIGAFHVGTLSALDAVDELSVTDVVPVAIDSVTGRYPDARGCADADAVLASGVDGLVIASATATHAALIEQSVAAGIPVFCEKPIAMSSGESAAVVDRCGGSGVPVAIGYNRRFDPAVSAARAAVVSGELGFITTARSTTLDPAPPPMSYIAGSGGIFRDCAVHDFDTLRWVVGGDVVEVYATGANQGDPGFTAHDDVDSATVILTFASGAMGVVSATRYNGRGYDCRLEVHGSTDSVVAGWDPGTPVRNLDPGCAFPDGSPHGFFMDRFAQAYRRELGEFCDLVGGAASSSLCTMNDALAVALIADAATVSLHEKRPVRIDEIAESPSAG
ncbi:dehydrogenase [Gordonia amarae]|uniref:Myo-inositol 2-dehydrogenase n=2 Tax=Gordonia amarae TaxID=36821 RepID=G7GWR5_9ACTN|nr:Gfo/Idh/MocA family oxidoreductase [Gordonia amarae]MCS3880862.1 myo-inositol 2-dehydrogenase/D-chiro-inositol 1-dehydrogenase [Gordonia amarae]QHN19122.1 dehydrogenase [Gordonia amarae]QHN23598.1 dehydrogenase [Gordonia amarae]QHN32509.1 dehydrogenase [Gordonia amarae]QHN41257.1 dehydrogenase [Gordonia amarae]